MEFLLDKLQKSTECKRERERVGGVDRMEENNDKGDIEGRWFSPP